MQAKLEKVLATVKRYILLIEIERMQPVLNANESHHLKHDIPR
jgi:hypothetical protein